MRGTASTATAILVLSCSCHLIHGENCDDDYFKNLRHLGRQGREQNVVGPMQDDEALLLFALARTMGVTRVLEVGGLGGFSATNFLAAIACARGGGRNAAVYTVDINIVPRIGPYHRTIRSSAERLMPSHLDNTPVDMIFLDCHVYHATTRLLRRILSNGLLSPDGIIALHDTGIHASNSSTAINPVVAHVTLDDGKRGYMHQPVERLVAQWLVKWDCRGEWQTLVAHDDLSRGVAAKRHGLTIMQRRVSLQVPQFVCEAGQYGLGGVGPSDPNECELIQAAGDPGPLCHNKALPRQHAMKRSGLVGRRS